MLPCEIRLKNGNDSFFFKNDATALEAIRKQVKTISKNIEALLHQSVTTSFEKGEDDLKNELRSKAENITRSTAGEAYLKQRGSDGLSMSDRVWNLSKNSSKEMEIIIQNGVKEGKTVQEVAKSIQGYLNEPKKLFKRVKNTETGELELSKAAQKYNPGQGVYRSAYANAMRLARTEMRKAYLEAQWQAAQSEPMITGWEIKLSNNHTTLKKGKAVHLHDMCDELAGVYPKSFKFTGWHPQCRCNMIPVLATNKEVAALLQPQKAQII